MTYFEWAGTHRSADHRAVAADRRAGSRPTALPPTSRARRYTRASRTSISGALLFAKPLFEGSGYRGVRRVIDVSGDGANNNGPLVTVMRDEVLAEGHHHQRPADHAQAAERRSRWISTSSTSITRTA